MVILKPMKHDGHQLSFENSQEETQEKQERTTNKQRGGLGGHLRKSFVLGLARRRHRNQNAGFWHHLMASLVPSS
jgi:hypothetical protein